MIVQCLVHAGDGLHLLQHGTDIVADKDDGTIAVDLCQKLIKPGFKTLVDVGTWLVEHH